MNKLLKFVILVTIVLLHSSMSWSKSDNDSIHSSTGEPTNDSVLIAYSDLRIANSKMIELKYEQEINRNYRTIVSNDSIAINSLNLRIDNMVENHKRDIRRVKRERNLLGITSIGAFIALLVSLF